MKNTNSARKTVAKGEGLLMTVARTIGSTLGTVAAKAGVSKPARRRKAARKSPPKVQKKSHKTKAHKTQGKAKT